MANSNEPYHVICSLLGHIRTHAKHPDDNVLLFNTSSLQGNSAKFGLAGRNSQLHCLFNSVFLLTIKKRSKLRILILFEEKPLLIGGFPSQWDSNAESYDVIIYKRSPLCPTITAPPWTYDFLTTAESPSTWYSRVLDELRKSTILSIIPEPSWRKPPCPVIVIN